MSVENGILPQTQSNLISEKDESKESIDQAHLFCLRNRDEALDKESKNSICSVFINNILPTKGALRYDTCLLRF